MEFISLLNHLFPVSADNKKIHLASRYLAPIGMITLGIFVALGSLPLISAAPLMGAATLIFAGGMMSRSNVIYLGMGVAALFLTPDLVCISVYDLQGVIKL